MKNLDKLSQKKLEEILLDEKIDRNKLEECLSIARASNCTLAETMINRGLLDDSSLTQILSNRLQLPFLSLANWNIDPEVFKKIPTSIMNKYQLIPLEQFEDVLTILISGVPTQGMFDEIQVLTQNDLFVYLGNCTEIVEALKKYATPDAVDASASQDQESTGSNLTSVIPATGEATAGWESIFDLGDENVKKELKDKFSNVVEKGGPENEFEDFMNSVQAPSKEYEIEEPPAMPAGEEMISESQVQSGKEPSISAVLNASDPQIELESGPAEYPATASNVDTGSGMDSSSSGGDPQEAQRAELAQLAAHLSHNPQDYDAINQYIKTAIDLGDVKSAVRQLGLFARGLEQSGKTDEAMDCFQYMLDLDPDNREAKKKLKK